MRWTSIARFLSQKRNSLMKSPYRSVSWLTILPVAVLALKCSPCSAELLTIETSAIQSLSTINFSQFVTQPIVVLQTGQPPLDIGQLVGESVLVRPISGTSAVGVLFGVHSSPYYLGSGSWGPNRNGFLGIGGGDGTRVVLRIEFPEGPIATVGGLFNYPSDPRWHPVTMSALDVNLNVLERYEINGVAPIFTIGDDIGEFRGIARGHDEIYALEISAPFAVIDDIRFGRVVPEPHSTFIVLGIVIATFCRRFHI